MSATVLLVVIIVVLIAAAAVSVTAMVFQSHNTARVNAMERELEEKTLEFLALKKERATAKAAAKAPAPIVDDTPVDTDIAQQRINDGNIQITRNVRGNFQSGDSDAGHAAPVSPARPAAPVYPAPSPAAPPALPGAAVPLFSGEIQGPDLNMVYQSLLSIMETGRPHMITLNCAGVDFLSDPELDYLFQVYSSLVSQGH
nr:hypothetical protein [Chitinispirillaceae bacterium]